MSEGGLRERKKRQTRDALVDAACVLFGRQGFEATTIDQIAAAVDVSPRTFFRYFASKDEVALELLDQQLSAVIEALAGRPADESVITALRGAVVGVVRAYERDEPGFDGARHRSVRALLAGSPALLASSLQQGVARSEEVARLLGERMGVDPAADGRPDLVAAITLCALQAAVSAWQVHRRATPLSVLLGEAFDLLADGLDYPPASAAGDGDQL
jgi:AcrR family transcriptional regulator